MVACAARLLVRPVCQIRTSHLMSRCVPEVQENTRDHNDDVHTGCSSTTCTPPVHLLQSDAQPTPSVLPVPSTWNSAMVSSYPPFFLLVSPSPMNAAKCPVTCPPHSRIFFTAKKYAQGTCGATCQAHISKMHAVHASCNPIACMNGTHSLLLQGVYDILVRPTSSSSVAFCFDAAIWFLLCAFAPLRFMRETSTVACSARLPYPDCRIAC